MPKLKIEINDEDFLKKTTKEQNLIMFKKICSIDKNGCSWAINHEKNQSRKLYKVGAGAGFLGGFSAVISLALTKLVFWK